jgi:hydroxypyruvate isomerase
MHRIAANVTTLFPDLPLVDRVGRAAAIGFDGVECLFPYETPPETFAELLRAARMPLALINTPEPAWSEGARGCAAIPGRSVAFRERFAQALSYARTGDGTCIHVMAGVTDAPEAFDTFVENLRFACATAPERRITIEPLNPADMPGYWLSDFDRAASVIDVVDAPNLFLQFDAWHAQRIAGDALAVWEAHRDRVGHVQIAGLAARGAPDPNSADEAALLAALGRAGDAWIAAEYIGQSGDDAAWLDPVRAGLARG